MAVGQRRRASRLWNRPHRRGHRARGVLLRQDQGVSQEPCDPLRAGGGARAEAARGRAPAAGRLSLVPRAQVLARATREEPRHLLRQASHHHLPEQRLQPTEASSACLFTAWAHKHASQPRHTFRPAGSVVVARGHSASWETTSTPATPRRLSSSWRARPTSGCSSPTACIRSTVTAWGRSAAC